MKINDIVFDMENKEHVKISNGIPKTDANGREIMNDIKPTEAIALRVIGFHSSKLIMVWTYRKINEDKLMPPIGNVQWFKDAMEASEGRI